VRACPCETSFSTCNAVGASDLVFIGTVQAIDPISLNLWNMPNPSSLRSLNEAYTDAQQHPSPAALARFKDAYIKSFPDLAENAKREMASAKTISDATSLFYSALYRGIRVRFKVKTVFKNGDEADDAKNPAANDKDQTEADDSFVIWTPFGDCGYDFQVGETYLVYANDDEEGSHVFFTGSCTRTRRLSDAGEDLAYLFFYKDRRDESARLEGFTTTDELYQLGLDHMHDPETVRSPAAEVIVELQSDRLTRFAESDRNGKFVFDGLSQGDYKLSAFAPGYPFDTRLLTGPRPFHIYRGSCARQILLLPKSGGN